MFTLYALPKKLTEVNGQIYMPHYTPLENDIKQTIRKLIFHYCYDYLENSVESTYIQTHLYSVRNSLVLRRYLNTFEVLFPRRSTHVYLRFESNLLYPITICINKLMLYMFFLSAAVKYVTLIIVLYRHGLHVIIKTQGYTSTQQFNLFSS